MGKSKNKGASKNEKNTTKTQAKETQSQQNEATNSASSEKSSSIPDPESFNGAELTMTQLYDIIRNLSSQVFDKQKINLENKLSTMQSEIDDLKKEIKQKNRSIEKLQWEKENQDKQIQELLSKMDELEQQQYDHDVKLIGLPDTECNEEEEKQKLINFARDTLDMKLKPTDIIQLQRLGKYSETKPTRSLIVRFKKISTRRDFYQRRKKTFVNADPKKNVYINDRITVHRSNLLYAARKLVKCNRIHSAWTQHGNILIKKTQDDKPTEIRTHEDLTQFRVSNDWMKDVIIEEVDTSDLPDTSDEEDD